jgi:uncharacterized protein
MTIKRALLITLTVLALWLMGENLWVSWHKPQIQSRLELYQTDLLLQATELKATDANSKAIQQALLGGDPVKSALEQYQTVRQAVEKNLQRTEQLQAQSVQQKEALTPTAEQLKTLLADLDLNLGLLQTVQRQAATGQKTWASLDSPTAKILAGLWSDPVQILPNAESDLKTGLEGWFRDRALDRLYNLQQRPTEQAALQANAQVAATDALNRLVLIGGLPVLGLGVGAGVLLLLLGQWLLQQKQALLSPEGLQPWSPPWDGEVIWQVIVGFVWVGQIQGPLLAVVFAVLGFDPSQLSERARAFYLLFNYSALATGALSILYFSVQQFLPLPEGWFRLSLRGRWWLWGIGGYLAALPLVLAVSLINQRIWQGQGGNNPILPIALAGKDSLALAVFVFTASVAAPLFEEVLFRGFLLPSLTRYMSTWGAIALSSLIFAVAHLSLSEVLPLMTLGMVLGFVYARSRNLAAAMLLHGLWNAGTLVSLFVLGGARG